MELGLNGKKAIFTRGAVGFGLLLYMTIVYPLMFAAPGGWVLPSLLLFALCSPRGISETYEAT